MSPNLATVIRLPFELIALCSEFLSDESPLYHPFIPPRDRRASPETALSLVQTSKLLWQRAVADPCRLVMTHTYIRGEVV